MNATLSLHTAVLAVSDLVSAYLDNLELRNRAGLYSTGQRILVGSYLSDFSAFYGGNSLESCCNSDLTRWLLAHPTWKADATKAAALNAVLGCMRWCVDERLISYNPYRKPKGLRIKPQPRAPFTPEEYKSFMSWARNKKGRRKRPSAPALRCAAYFLWRTGARTCEMRCLLRCDLDFVEGVARPPHHKTDETGDPRQFGLDDRVIRLLRRLTNRIDMRPCRCEESKHREHRRGDHVFVNSRGTAWTKDTFGKLFRTFARLAGIEKKKTAYCLRHGFCVAAIHKGISDRAIANQLGHQSTRMIAWYGRQSRQSAKHLRDVVTRVND